MDNTGQFLTNLVGTMKGTIAVVLGNGESRLDYDIADLKELGDVITIGCNAMLREEAKPDILSSVDVNITSEIIQSGWIETNKYICCKSRYKQWQQSGLDLSNLILVDIIRGWSTGPMAVLAAAALGCNPIFLLGFDMAWAPREEKGKVRVNNVFRDSPHYRKSDASPTNSRNWENQFRDLFSRYPDVEFLQVGPHTLSEGCKPAVWGDIVLRITQSVPAERSK